MRLRDAAAPPRSVSRAAFLAMLVVASLAVPASAQAAGLTRGFFDGIYQSTNAGTRAEWLDRTVDSRSEIVLLVAPWRSIAPANEQGLDATDPGDPAYSWGVLDQAVRDATARDLKVLMLVTSAPNWAEGANRAPGAAAGTWLPQPGELREFGRAIAKRYSGTFTDPDEPLSGALPRVGSFQLWAEPNLSVYLTPQWRGGKQKSAGHYRKMLDAFSKGVNAVDGSMRVVTGGTAPYGDSPGGPRTRPLRFWRGVFCLSNKLKPHRCNPKPRLDVLAHHPINTSGGPHVSAAHPDNVSTPDLKHLVRVLRTAERANNVVGGHHPVWVTEIWWESDPPDDVQGVPVGRQARWLEDALYLLWKQGARVVVNLQIRDQQFDPQNPFLRNATGVFFSSGGEKPAFRAWRFPFVTHRRSRTNVGAWGIAPAAGDLRIERKRGNDWRLVEHFNVAEGKVFNRALRLPGRERMRARVGSETSLVWTQSG